MKQERLKTLSSFLQQHGFVWGPAPEIYGGLAGFYTYGPNGTLLKRKIEHIIRKRFAQDSIREVEVPTVLPKEVWEASGHLGGFTDPLIKDVEGGVWRADKLIEEHFAENNIEQPVPVTHEELLSTLKECNINAPNGLALTETITDHNLMMKTTIGLDTEAYNRPETATATYLPFLRYVDYFRKKLPFGVYQIGKAYRNEISPRQHIIRQREFTQAEGQIFVDPEHKNNYEGYEQIKEAEIPLYSWSAQTTEGGVCTHTVQEAVEQQLFGSCAYAYAIHLAYDLFKEFGIPEDHMRLRQHGPEEKAFYAADAWDVEVYTPTFGWVEACGVHDRTNYDLDTHAKHSNKELTIYIEERKEHITPHVLEIAFGVDRPLFALLDIFYDQKEEGEGKTTLKLPYSLAPIDVCVLPLTKKQREKAQEIYQQLLSKGIIASYDESGSIGKRYLRASIIGTPVCITVDYDTQEDNTVTIRDRDSEEQKRITIEELLKKW